VVWALLAIPTLLIWKDSILWVATMSLYANFVGHWSAYQAARSEKEASNGRQTDDGVLEERGLQASPDADALP
jgi:hypothetical protein